MFFVLGEQKTHKRTRAILLRWVMAANVGIIALSSLSGCGSSSGPGGLTGAIQGVTLPAGTGSVSITSSWIVNSKGQLADQTDSQGQVAWQKESGMIDGLTLTGTAGADKALFSELKDSSAAPYYCLGMTGMETSGTLGGLPYQITLTCIHSAEQYPTDDTMNFTGEWGKSAIHLTGEVSVATHSPVSLSGTVGTQHVTATITMTPGLYPGESPADAPPGTPRYNSESGPIKVS